MIETIKEYSTLINIGLFGIIIGWLFHISRLSRTAIIDKYEAKIAAKEKEIEALNHQISYLEKNHQAEISVLEHGKAFFEKLASLPEDQAVEALKIEYQLRLEELEKREAAASKVEEKAEIEEEKFELKQLVDTAASALASSKQVVDFAKLVSRLM